MTKTLSHIADRVKLIEAPRTIFVEPIASSSPQLWEFKIVVKPIDASYLSAQKFFRNIITKEAFCYRLRSLSYV